MVPDDLAQHGHLHLHVRLLDDATAPGHAQQVVLGQQAVMVMHQRKQQLESTPAEVDGLAAAQQQSLGGPKLEVAEAQTFRHDRLPS